MKLKTLFFSLTIIFVSIFSLLKTNTVYAQDCGNYFINLMECRRSSDGSLINPFTLCDPGVSSLCCASSADCTTAAPPTIAGGDAFQPTECDSGSGIVTALGCISTTPLAFIVTFIDILLGIAGGISLLLMIVGIFFILTSRGQPEQIKRGKEIITAAIIGLLTIIFSTFLLELIGVDLLGLFK